MDRTIGTSRRDLLRACMAGALAAERHVRPTAAKSKVVIARDPLLRTSGLSNKVLSLLDRAMESYDGAGSPVDAWRKLVRPGEIVGLKVNCLAGRGTASTSVVLVEAVCERLRQAGIADKDIVIWDRLNADLESAGYRITSRPDRMRCLGNDTAGYENELAIYGSVGSRLSQTLTRTCDAIINLPVLKDHGIVGVSMALKNLFGSIHNPNKYHTNAGDPYIADVNMLAPIRQKVRLTICDALTAQYEGGPSFMPQWSWPYNGLITSADPVALDYIGWQILERKRAEKGLKSLRDLEREPTYIARAADAQHCLGSTDPKSIDLVEA
jgi:uncharacterized protein (DUF362 family)